MDKVITGKCLDYTHDGRGVIKVRGIPIFVENVLVGEEAKVLITREAKGFCEARRLELITVSAKRIKPACPYFRVCGGCHIQHMAYDEQLGFKTKRVKEALKRIGGVEVEVPPTLGMEHPFYYRNKVQVPIGYNKENKVVAGFYKKASHEIVDIEKCRIEDYDGDKIILFMKTLMDKYHISAYDVDLDKGLIRTILVRKSNLNRDLMVVIITRSMTLPHKEEIVQELTSNFSRIKTIVHNINNAHTSIMLGHKENILFGPGYIEDAILGVKFKVSPKSFYQINPKQTEILYTKAIEFAALKPTDVVLDAYCGVGTIGLIVANKVNNVVGVEIVEDAISDAKHNAELNHIKNAKFICADAKQYIAKANKDGVKFDVVFVDPPRNGCDPAFIQSLIEVQPQKIVYVSCEPSSLARDLKMLKEYYDVVKCQPVDMFPQTYHVETVVGLYLKDINK